MHALSKATAVYLVYMLTTGSLPLVAGRGRGHCPSFEGYFGFMPSSCAIMSSTKRFQLLHNDCVMFLPSAT